MRAKPRVLLIALALILAAPSAASGVVSNVRLIDGPDSALSGEVDAAMSEDGSGGVVYLKRLDGRNHVFATQFRNGTWSASQRIDVGQNFDSSWPRIAAGDGGRLLVTWVQEFGLGSDRIYSATLDPGATGFQAPVPVDFNVGEATSTSPDLAMNRGGQAYLIYNVVTDTSAANPAGYLGIDVRVARYSNRLWSSFGGPIDRNSAVPMRTPTQNIAPEVAIDVQGNGVIAWLEPDDEFVDRVWSRRLFTTRTGIPLQVSPSTFDGAPLRGGADTFALDVAGFGRAAVAFRQQPGQSSRLDASHIFVNELPEAFAELAGEFQGARLVDGAAVEALGAPYVAVDPTGTYAASFSSGPVSLVANGDEETVGPVSRLDRGGSSIPGDPLIDISETGAAVAAWRELREGVGQVAVQERRADGVVEATALGAPQGGQVGDIAIGASGLGDAIIAWPQGTGAFAQVAATVVDAPPDPFLVLVPNGWQGAKKIPIEWNDTLNAIGGVTYSVSVDDEPVIEGLRGLDARLGPDETENGRLKVQIFAADEAGQETGSRIDTLLVDRKAPEVSLKARGRAVTVVVSDGPRKSNSGLKRGQAEISFGDGTEATATEKSNKSLAMARHSFKEGGIYPIVVEAKDRAGNRVRVQRKVKVG